MKGPNPFALWEDDPGSISGRKEEARSFSSFVNAASSRQGGVLLVIGGPGVGKSAILRYFHHEAGKAGMAAVYVNAEKGEDESALANKCHSELLSAGALKGPLGGPPPSGMAGFLDKAQRVVSKGSGLLVLIDDFDLMKRPDALLGDIVALAKTGWGKREIGFVLSSTRELKAPEGPIASVFLKPFDEHETRDLVDKALKKGPPKMGEECLMSLISDTGGNPRLLKRICHDIYERLRDNEKLITKGHYLAYLPQIMGALSREWFGGMYQETPMAERAILGALSKEEAGMHVSDIAKKIGKPLGPVSALTKRLLDSGQIVRLDRGKYRIFSKLYARYVSQRG
ncbi:MAG: AAA family ATPase [Candidatus Micrarchaeota archaeon]